MRREVFFLLLTLLVTPSPRLWAEVRGVVQTDEVVVLFQEPLGRAAKEVVNIYPALRRELEKTLGWRVGFRPQVLLIHDREAFVRMAGSDLFVALALPREDLVVIDYSKMSTAPFSLAVILKHELTHLLLHHHIRRAELPKWLDEGVSQWVSGGIAEVIIGRKGTVLKEATLSGNYLSLDSLVDDFPRDKRSLILAYEESRSFVEFISGTFGVEGLLEVLGHLKEGDDADVAVFDSLSVPLDELERRWHRHLRKQTTWLTYLAGNLYGILFFAAALITIVGFIRLLIMKRRRYGHDEDDHFPGSDTTCHSESHRRWDKESQGNA
jgi:hypothetical protein